MKKILVLVVMVAVMLTGCFASPEKVKGDIGIYTVNNKDGKITANIIEEAFIKGGFNIGLNSDINDGLTKMYSENNFKIYSTISIYHKTLTMDILKKYPDAGVFLPMGMAIYQTNSDDSLHIAVTTAATQAKIAGTKPEVFHALEAEIAKVIKGLFPKAKHAYNDKSLEETRTLLTKHSLDIKGEDFEDAKESLEEAFEEAFEEAKFVMPSYFDLTAEFGEDSPYDFYTTYSICKIDVIRSIAKVRPEAAAFAPCTTMMYKKKGEDKIVMGFTAVYNWLSSAGIQDKESVDALMSAQTVFEGILKDVTK
jgi:uncharacterized protein (DUF302 family)